MKAMAGVPYDAEPDFNPPAARRAVSRVQYLPQFPELTPAMRSVLERMARAGHTPLYALPPQQAKAAYEAGAGVLEVPKPPLPRIADFEVPVRDGSSIPARLYTPVVDAI